MNYPINPCLANGCLTRVPKGKLFCRLHWSAVPKWIKFRILQAYTIGQFKNGTVNREWVESVKDACLSVRDQELPRRARV